MNKLIVLAIFVSTCPQAEPDSHRQKVVDRLKDVMAAFAKAEAISYEVESSIRRENDANPARVEHHQIALKRPNVGRIEHIGPRGGLRVSNGKEMWFGAPKSPTYSRVRLNESTFNRYFQTDYFVNQLFLLKDPEALIRKQVDFSVEKEKIDGTPHTVVSWKGLSSYARVTQVRLLLDDRNLPRRMERKSESPIFDSGGMYQTILETYEISNLVLNPEVAADAFAFKPPEGSTEHDPIETNIPGKLPDEPGAEAATGMLERVRAALKSVESVDYTVEIRLEGPKVDPKTQPTRRRVRAKRPGLIRIDSVSPVEDKTVLVDGEWTWTIEKEKKKYMRTWLFDPYLSTGPDNDPWFRLMWERKPTRVLARGRDVKTGREKAGDAECDFIQWIRDDNYAITAGGGGGTYEVLWKFWIDADGKPRRVTKATEHGDNIYKETCTYGPVDLKAKIEPEVFTFAPPADWKSSGTDLEDYMLAVGSKAPEVEGTGLDGKTIKLSDYKGQAVVLTFWAAWSPFCVEEMGNLAPIHKAYAKRGTAFLAVSREDPPKTIEKHFKANGLPFTALLQKRFEISAAFGVRIEPTTYLIGRDGAIAARWICVEEGELRRALDAALSK